MCACMHVCAHEHTHTSTHPERAGFRAEVLKVFPRHTNSIIITFWEVVRNLDSHLQPN